MKEEKMDSGGDRQKLIEDEIDRVKAARELLEEAQKLSAAGGRRDPDIDEVIRKCRELERYRKEEIAIERCKSTKERFIGLRTGYLENGRQPPHIDDLVRDFGDREQELRAELQRSKFKAGSASRNG
ncbi:uncharacterized protein K452DRAFT_321937 [Aplosporella prunicola CBS 121167]|uniref:Uncharacterized protein n=1 Tax=Aplosporella prunicola CBS 121167 TaxID=1176127 RepID=A0A6A6B1I9_9PEZI|nr:uncharacterized protein K452DRAFT_321937 [Aplosporella prunicola CBS 121167]KAF2137243.1 hypothetical protein K452DRAFT_321937 [Aplosporella prunicola CBS 121167]